MIMGWEEMGGEEDGEGRGKYGITNLHSGGCGGESNQGTSCLIPDGRARRLQQVVYAPDEP